MIHKNTLTFLKDLGRNNSKYWLNNNRKKYEGTQGNILALTVELITSLSSIDTTISNTYFDPKKCITRLNKDLRFAKDKTPYKSDFYIILNKNGKKSPSAFYYVHIEPNNCFVGGGVYNPLPEHLKKIRQEIDHFFDEWTSIINDKTFKKIFPSGIHNSGILTRIPKGFSEASRASDFLKMKGFYTKEKISDIEIQSKDSFAKIISCFKAIKSLVSFLNRAIEK